MHGTCGPSNEKEVDYVFVMTWTLKQRQDFFFTYSTAPCDFDIRCVAPPVLRYSVNSMTGSFRFSYCGHTVSVSLPSSKIYFLKLNLYDVTKSKSNLLFARITYFSYVTYVTLLVKFMDPVLPVHFLAIKDLHKL